jgi:hypothetical protein
MESVVYVRALQRAAEILGGEEELQAHLGAPATKLALWLQGTATPPTAIFLKVVDLLVDCSVREVGQSISAATRTEPEKRA